jgi:hypothetical protein
VFFFAGAFMNGKLKVLIACESSGNTRREFCKLGHDAWSCDIQAADDGDEHHYQCDVREVLHMPWDLLISHPTCTYLCSSGLHWNKRRPERAALTEEAVAFARVFIDGPETAHIPKRVTENPIGCLSSRIRKPEQIIQPWQFGHNASKATCLWIDGLPLLVPTKYIDPRLVCCGKVLPDDVGKYGCPNCEGTMAAKPRWVNQTDSGQNNLPPSADRWKIRSETYQGISEAMARQWGGPVFDALSGMNTEPLEAV